MRILSCLIALLLVASDGRAETSQPPPLVVHVIDCARVSGSAMSVAEQAVTQAFRTVGIRAVWREDSGVEAPSVGHHVTVVILSKAMSRRKATTDATPGNALGTAAPAARRAWIFIDRIHDLASRHQTSLGTLLGIVIAHEVAHVAADITHSRDSIMEPQLRITGNPLRGFNASEGQQLRHALSRVIADSPWPAIDATSGTARRERRR